MSQDRFIAAEVGKLVAHQGLSPEAAHIRVKNFTTDGHIVSRQRSTTDKRKTILYSAGDALTAAALGALTDLGGLGKNAIQAAASRLQAWREGEVWTPDSKWLAAAQKAADEGKEPPERPKGVAKEPESPAQWMMDNFAADPSRPPGFTLHLTWQRNPAGNVIVTSDLTHGDFGPLGGGRFLMDANVPVAGLVLPIDPMLLDLHVRIAKLGA